MCFKKEDCIYNSKRLQNLLKNPTEEAQIYYGKVFHVFLKDIEEDLISLIGHHSHGCKDFNII